MSWANVYSQSETLAIIYRELGPCRAWSDFLADCIRGRTDFQGLQLQPVAYAKGRARRPVYDVEQVAEFIREAKRRYPASLPHPVGSHRVWIEVPAPGAPPLQRTAHPAGSTPITR